MTNRSRAARLPTALALFLTLPGLAPYRAAAQSIEIRVAPVAGISGAASASAAAGAAGLSLRPGAAPVSSFSPVAPAFSGAPLAAPSAAPGAAAQAAIEASAEGAPLPHAVSERPAAVPAARADAARSAAARPVLAGAPFLRALSPERLPPLRAPSVEATLKDAAVPSASAAAFDGSAARGSLTETVPAAAAPAAPALSRLSPASAGPRWVLRPETPAARPAPRASLKRTLSVGYLTGFLGLAFTQIATMVAGVLGWVPNSNYHFPVDLSHPSLAMVGVVGLVASVMAPISEEILFRAGLQGGLSKLTKKLHLGSFVLPALVTAALFVVVHETADPVMMAVRMVFALALSRVFYKEGVLASMSAHATFNGLTFVPLLLMALHVPLIGQVAAMPLSAYFAYRAWQTLKAQRAEIASGALTSAKFGVKHALMAVPILLGGFLFLMPNLIWLAGAAALVLWLGAKGAAAAYRALRARRS
jgi:hypothetical protein